MAPKPQFIRFVVHRRHWRSGARSGIFQALNDILDGDDPPEHLRPAITELSNWFNANLRRPFHQPTSGFRVTRRPKGTIDPEPRSLSWIKLAAAEHIAKLRHLKILLEEAGWAVEEISATNVSRILYEDDHQVVAIPFADTPT